MTDTIKISAVILAREEEATIARVVAGALPYADEVLVVDGHSLDRTAELSRRRGGAGGFRTTAGARATVIAPGWPRRAARWWCFSTPTVRTTRPISPSWPRPSVRAGSIWSSPRAGAAGSDDVHPNLSHFLRDLGGNFLSLVISARFRVEVTDCLNGFRALRRESGLTLGLRADDFDIEHEMVMKALKAEAWVGEVGSHEYARAGGASKLPTFAKAHKFFIRLLVELF
ncbi:MAG: hypothetical protein MZV65_38290 [Chromatiales bacterium]|nr:hypothetical protein [Chromatiales bacterium]